MTSRNSVSANFTARGMAALVMALLVVAAAPAAAASEGLDQDDDRVPNPALSGTVHKTVHNMSHSADALDYNDDNGEWQTLPGELGNTSNPISIHPDAIGVDLASYDGKSLLDTGSWTTSSNVSVGSGDASVHDGGLAVTTDGTLASGDSATATYNASMDLTTDVSKRVLWATLDVSGADDNTTVVLQAHDEQGDYRALSTSKTGTFVVQQKLTDLAFTNTSGDGTLDSIDHYEIVVEDGDGNVTVSHLNVERLTRATYGNMTADTDGDDELETTTLYEPAGEYNITSLDTMGSAFDNATIHDLRFDYEQAASDVKYEFDEEAASEHESYDYAFGYHASFTFPDAVEVDLETGQLTDTVVLPGSRLLSAEYIEGAGTSTYEELEGSSAWQDLTSTYTDAGDDATVTIDSSIQEGTRYVVFEQWLVSSEDKGAMTESGGIGVPFGATGGGIVDFLTSLPGLAASAVTLYFGVIKGWAMTAFRAVTNLGG